MYLIYLKFLNTFDSQSFAGECTISNKIKLS